MDKNFEYGGRKFQLSKIEVFKQFHIVRRIGPILADLLPAMKDAKKLTEKGENEEAKFDALAKLAMPVMTGLSKLSDADADLVLFGLLSSVEIQQAAGNWAKVSTNTMLMVQDLELPALLHIAGRAFAFNLTSFFAALPR